MGPEKHSEYILPSTMAESARLERQGAKLYGGVDFLRSFLNENPAEILDVGCATGFFTRTVAEMLPGSSLLGMDANEERLAYARAKCQLANVEFIEGNLTQMPVADNSFDLVFTRFVLGHASDLAAAFQEMARVAKPGGRVVAYDMIHEAIWFSPEKPAFSKVMRKVIEVMQARGLEPSQGLHLASGMLRAQLQDVKVQAIPHSCLAADAIFEDCRQNWIDTILSLEEILGPNFEKATVEQALAELREDRNDTFLLELTVLASATKV